MAAVRAEAHETAAPVKAVTAPTRAPSAQPGASAASVLMLQRLVGNRATGDWIAQHRPDDDRAAAPITAAATPGAAVAAVTAAARPVSAAARPGPVVSRAPAKTDAQGGLGLAPGFLAIYKNQFRNQKAQLKGSSDKFQSFMGNASKFVGDYRSKSQWVNGAYSAAYGHYDVLMGQMKAREQTQQMWINLLMAFGLNVAMGGMGNALVAAKRISDTMNFWVVGGAVNSVAGAGLTPDVSMVAGPSDTAPVFKQLDALQKLDQLNQVLLPLAATGSQKLLNGVFEVDRLLDVIAFEEGNNPDGRMEKAEFDRREVALENAILDLTALNSSIDMAQKAFDTLWQSFFASPWPDERRAEQDIWIPWISLQNAKSDTWTAAAFGSPLEDPGFTEHMIALGMVGPKEPGGRLGASAQIDYQMKAAAAGQVKDIAAFWAKVFLQDV